VLEEWPSAKIWFILDDAEHVAIVDAHELGQSLFDSESASWDSKHEYKLLVTDDWEMRLDSGGRPIDLNELIRDFGSQCEHNQQRGQLNQNMKSSVLPKDEQQEITSYWEEVRAKMGL